MIGESEKTFSGKWANRARILNDAKLGPSYYEHFRELSLSLSEEEEKTP